MGKRARPLLELDNIRAYDNAESFAQTGFKIRSHDKLIRLSRFSNLVIKKQGQKTTIYRRYALIDHCLVDQIWDRGEELVR